MFLTLSCAYTIGYEQHKHLKQSDLSIRLEKLYLSVIGIS